MYRRALDYVGELQCILTFLEMPTAIQNCPISSRSTVPFHSIFTPSCLCYSSVVSTNVITDLLTHSPNVSSIGFTARPHCVQCGRAVLARAIPSVCHSVTFRCFVQMNEDTIVRFAASGTTIPLVSGEVNFIRMFAGDHPQRGRKSDCLPINVIKYTN